jgi:lysophospholipase L1-like esterase
MNLACRLHHSFLLGLLCACASQNLTYQEPARIPNAQAALKNDPISLPPIQNDSSNDRRNASAYAISAGNLPQQVPSIVMVGDRFSTSFFWRQGVDTPWQPHPNKNANHLLDTDQANGLDFLFEKLNRIRPADFKNFSNPTAVINPVKASSSSFNNSTLKTPTFDEQIDQVLKEKPFPNLILIWTGHNSMNWSIAYNDSELNSAEKQDAILEETREQIRINFETQLLKLLDRAVSENKKVAIVVFGMANFRSLLKASGEAEYSKLFDGDLFPQLQVSKQIMKSFYEPFTERTLRLVDESNHDFQKMVSTLQKAYQKHSKKVQISYSNELSKIEFHREHLNSVDAWHLSPSGHQQIAQHLYQGSLKALKFIEITK